MQKVDPIYHVCTFLGYWNKYHRGDFGGFQGIQISIRTFTCPLKIMLIIHFEHILLHFPYVEVWQLIYQVKNALLREKTGGLILVQKVILANRNKTRYLSELVRDIESFISQMNVGAPSIIIVCEELESLFIWLRIKIFLVFFARWSSLRQFYINQRQTISGSFKILNRFKFAGIVVFDAGERTFVLLFYAKDVFVFA